MRVLIVDDEVQIAAMLREILQFEQYEVRVARHGRDALDLLETFRADLILSDVMMPMMDGVELCRALAAHPTHHTIPIILASAGVRPALDDDCPHAAFLPKPFNIPVLLATIARFIPSRG